MYVVSYDCADRYIACTYLENHHVVRSSMYNCMHISTYSLSAAGRVIVMAIHQPRYAIFKLFDSLTLLSNGELVYHGPASCALDYFARIGQ